MPFEISPLSIDTVIMRMAQSSGKGISGANAQMIQPGRQVGHADKGLAGWTKG
jgi:hypothetical protein